MPRKILLADDSVTAQNMGRRILSEAGYEIVTVNNGSAALKKIAEWKPDLVILDVYMPGYGGLEVCQRLKETAETFAIPVLLTVGKLEPFRADEARRVHADAHLVKPFEATELLAALTKLEDKIVPRDEAPAAKSASGRKSGAGKGADFGDSMTGWKNRLAMPSAATTAETPDVAAEPPAPPASEAPRVSATAFRNFEHPVAATAAPAENAEGTVSSIYNGMVQDITADEIAAITAAAAAFGDRPATDIDPASDSRKSSRENVEAAALAAQTIEEAPVAAEPTLSTSISTAAIAEPVATESVAAIESATDDEVAAALDSLAPVAGIGNEIGGAEHARGQAENERVRFLEEIAVAAGTSQASGPRWVAEEIPLAAGESALLLEREMEKAIAFADVQGSDARAEATAEASIEPAEAVLVQEESHPEEVRAQESSDAVAEESPAIAAATEESVGGNSDAPDSAPPESVMEAMDVSPDNASEFGSMAETVAWRSAVAWSEEHPRAESAEVPQPTFHDDPEAARSLAATEASEVVPAEAAVSPEAVAEAPIPAEAVASEATAEAVSEQPTEVVAAEAAPTEQAREEEARAEQAPTDTDEEQKIDAVGKTLEVEAASAPESEAAFAAAASVGTGFRALNSAAQEVSLEGSSPSHATAESSEPAAVMASASATHVERSPERETELAAAWASWRQIRESIGSPEAPAPPAEKTLEDAAVESAAGTNGTHHHAPEVAPESAASAASADEASDPSTIASIVDSMLAELRPRLVEEIAKKMGKDRK